MNQLQDNTLLNHGTYRIVRYLASGGFGNTYEAMHVLLGKRVAIKEFFVKDFNNRDEATNRVTVGTQSKVALVDKLMHKFINEAQAIAALSHPNIVRVTDIFEENGTAYYVMDFIEGRSLGDIVKHEGALSESRAIGYICQVASALEYIHSLNRLHLDIKPSNIMVDTQDKAILIDFGASKQYDEENGENTSTLLGKTPGYAPLEQMGNNVSHFTPATDIYALGATLFKLLTGNTPPEANILVAGIETLSFPASISTACSSAISKAMNIRPADRPQSVASWIQILKFDTNDYNDEVTTIDIVSVDNHLDVNNEIDSITHETQSCEVVTQEIKEHLIEGIRNIQTDYSLEKYLIDKGYNPESAKKIITELRQKLHNGLGHTGINNNESQDMSNTKLWLIAIAILFLMFVTLMIMLN